MERSVVQNQTASVIGVVRSVLHCTHTHVMTHSGAHFTSPQRERELLRLLIRRVRMKCNMLFIEGYNQSFITAKGWDLRNVWCSPDEAPHSCRTASPPSGPLAVFHTIPICRSPLCFHRGHRKVIRPVFALSSVHSTASRLFKWTPWWKTCEVSEGDAEWITTYTSISIVATFENTQVK